MNALNTFLSEQTVQRLGWVLIHFLWQGIAIAALMWCVLKVLSKVSANTRYITACVGLVLMVAAPTVTFMILDKDELVVAETAITPTPPAAVAPTSTVSKTVVISDIEPMALPKPSLMEVLTARLETTLPYCVTGWLFGVAALSMWYLGGWCQLQRLRRIGTRSVPVAIAEKTSEIAQRLGIKQAIHIAESVLVQVPAVVGWLKPVILLPATALTGLDEMQLQAMIAHELAHIKRCDYLVNIVQTVVEILGFYHPAVWWMSKQIRIERENCCDDMAVALLQNKKEYANALFSMEAIRSKQLDLAVAANGGHLTNRIKRLAGKPTQNTKSGWIPSAVASVLIMAIIIPAFAINSSKSEDSGAVDISRQQLQQWVEDFFNHNYRDITSRKTLEWGEPMCDSDGHHSIRYKYEAVIWGKDTIIADERFTFDKNGKFVSVKKLNQSKIPAETYSNDVRVYQVNRKVSDFPDNDFSTPESAAAHMNRMLANGETLREISEPSLKKRMPTNRPKIEVPEKGANEWRNAEIEEVRIYKDLYAAVLMRTDKLFGDTIDVRYLKYVDNQWLNMGNDVFGSLEKARKKFKTIYEYEENKQREADEIAKYKSQTHIRSYQVNRKVSGFPATEDFSTPESAYVAINRIMAADDCDGWIRVSAKTTAAFLKNSLKQTRDVDPEWAKVVLNAHILEVRIKDDRAVVIAEFPQELIDKPVIDPIDCRYLKREDGKWLNTSGDRFNNLRQAYEKFDTILERQSKTEQAYKTALEDPGRFSRLGQELFDKLRSADYEKILSYYDEQSGMWRQDGWKKLDIDYMVHTDWPSFAVWVCKTFKDNTIQSYILGDVFNSDKNIADHTNVPAIPYKLILKDGGILQGDLYFVYWAHTDKWQAAEGIDWHLQNDPIKQPVSNDSLVRASTSGTQDNSPQILTKGYVVRVPKGWPKLKEVMPKEEANNTIIPPEKLAVFLDAVRKQSQAVILSMPSIQTIDNQGGELSVGGENDPERIKLNITNHVAPDGKAVRTEVVFERMLVKGDEFTAHEITSMVMAPSGSAFALGGYEAGDGVELLLIQPTILGDQPSEDTISLLNAPNVPYRDQIQFPKNWDEISKKHSGPIEIQMPAEMDSKNQLLETKIDFSPLTKETTLNNAIEYIANATTPPLKIIVLWDDLKDNANIDKNTSIGIEGLGTMTLNLGLKSILNAISEGLVPVDFVEDEGNIVIATKDSLPMSYQTQIYDVSDILHYSGTNRKPAGDIDELKRTIVQSIVPSSWFGNGGDGRIDVYNDDKLIIYQTSQVHEALKQYFSKIREELSKQVAIEARFMLITDNFMEDIGLDFSSNSNDADDNVGDIVVGLANSEEVLAALKPKPLEERQLPELVTQKQKPQTLDDLQSDFINRAAAAHRDTKILSAPKATVLNGESAGIQVFSEWPYIDTDEQEKFVLKGVKLDIQPVVQSNGKDVLLKGHIQMTDILENRSVEQNGNTYNIPYLQVANIPIHAMVENTGTLLIEGPEITVSKVVEKDTGMSKIPIGGRTFSSRSKIIDKKHLLILIKPTIIKQEEVEPTLRGIQAGMGMGGFGGGGMMGGYDAGGGMGGGGMIGGMIYQPAEKTEE